MSECLHRFRNVRGQCVVCGDGPVTDPSDHFDTGFRCLVAHSDHGACIKCSCGKFIPPGEWSAHRTARSSTAGDGAP